MKCILCKGSGVQPKPPKTALEKRKEARRLREKGLSLRKIADLVGWKSTRSVVEALRD